MEKKVFRVGSVGIGGISRGVHLPGIHKSPDLELVAVCDLKPERMEYARNTYGIREDHCFADYHDLIACPDVDAIDMQYFQAWGLPRANCPLVWRYVKSRTGTGALGDLGSHALDLVRFVTNKEYTRVVGHTGTYVHERPLLDGKGVGKVDVDDFSNYMADMEDEISVSFQITRFAYGRGNYQRMEIYGSEGAIVYSLDATPAGIDEIEVCSGDINADAHVFNHLPIPQQYFCDQMQSFADIVNGTGDGLAANIQDGQANQHLLDAIVESAEKGTWLSL